MTSKLIFGLLLVVAATAARPLGAQALAGRSAPAATLDPWISQALRQQLTAGYEQRREPSGILAWQAPDQPVRHAFAVVPESIAAPAPGTGKNLCPMPVAKMDPRLLAPMPVARADSVRLEKMPVGRSACVNP